jgi:hypothetical protein
MASKKHHCALEHACLLRGLGRSHGPWILWVLVCCTEAEGEGEGEGGVSGCCRCLQHQAWRFRSP